MRHAARRGGRVALLVALSMLPAAAARPAQIGDTLALYDLGRALQGRMKYDEAIGAYTEFLSRTEGSFKTEQWETPWFPTRWIALPDLLGPDVPGTVNYGLYYPAGTRFFVVVEQDIVAHDVQAGTELWRATMPEALSYPYLRHTADALVVLTAQYLLMLDMADGHVIYQRGPLGLPANSFDGPYAMNIVAVPHGAQAGYLIVFREGLASTDAADVKACLMAIDVGRDAELWRISWERPFGSGFVSAEDPKGLRSGNILARVSELVRYPQLVGDLVVFPQYADGRLVDRIVDARTGRDAGDQIHPAVRENLAAGYLYPDGTGGGWIPKLDRLAVSTVAACRDLTSEPTVSRGRALDYAQSCAVLWNLSRPKRIDDNDTNYVVSQRRKTVMFDTRLGHFRLINWPWDLTEKYQNEHGLQMLGDLVLFGTNDNKRVVLCRHEPAQEVVWEYALDQELAGSPALLGGTILVPEWAGLRSNSFHVRGVRPPQGKVPVEPADVWYRIAQCQRACGRSAECEAALRAALRFTPDHAGALRDLTGVFLEAGRSWEAHAHLQSWYRQEEATDADEDLIDRIADATGAIARIADARVGTENVKILPDRNLVVSGCYNGYSVIDLMRPERSWAVSVTSEKRGYFMAWASAYRGSTVSYSLQFFEQVPGRGGSTPIDRSEFLLLDLDARRGRHVRTAPLARVGMGISAWSEPLRREYDTDAQLFVDRRHPDQLVFLDPIALSEAGRLTLPEAVDTSKTAEAFFSNPCVMMALFTDRYVIAYAPPEGTPHFRVMAIDRRSHAILWSVERPMSEACAKSVRSSGWLPANLYPAGNHAWLYDSDATPRTSVLDIATGAFAGEGPPPGRVENCYASWLVPRERFHDPAAVVTIPKYPWEDLGGYWRGCQVWADGPKLVQGRGYRPVLVMDRDGVQIHPEVVAEWVYAAGPYAVMKLAHGRMYVYRNTALMRSLGYTGVIPDDGLGELIPRRKRADTPREFFRDQFRRNTLAPEE